MDNWQELLAALKRNIFTNDEETIAEICRALTLSDWNPDDDRACLYAQVCDTVTDLLSADTVCRIRTVVHHVLFIIQFLLLDNANRSCRSRLIDSLVACSNELSTPESLVLALELIVLLDPSENALANLDRVARRPCTNARPFIPNALKMLISESPDTRLCDRALYLLEQLVEDPDPDVREEARLYLYSAKSIAEGKRTLGE